MTKLDLRRVNSLTKYPSIPTFHTLDPRTGELLDEHVDFPGVVLVTEKVDGTNGRIITLPDGTWLVGSREELLTARGDLVHNPMLGIVDALRDVADDLTMQDDVIRVFYLEVYGGKIGKQGKHYGPGVGRRLFDVVEVADYEELLARPREQISSWREHGGQRFLPELELARWTTDDVELTPRLSAALLPTDVAQVRDWLGDLLPATRAALGDHAPGRAEGVVVRTLDRSAVAKIRFEDYDRTLRARRGK